MNRNNRFRRKLCLLLPVFLLAGSLSGCGLFEASSSGGDLFISTGDTSQVSLPPPASSLADGSPAPESVSSEASPAPEEKPTGTPAPFAAFLPQAEEMVKQLSTGEKVGQLFLPRFPESGAQSQIETYHPAGFILFARDFQNRTPAEVRELLAACRAASGTPLIFGVDEEGGTVTRVSRFSAFAPKKFASPQTVYQQGGMEAIVSDTKKKSAFLLDLGIGLNFAPVADVSTNPTDFIFDRSFGKSAGETAEFIRQSVQASLSEGVSPVLKHFPGYGNNADTHTGIAYDKRPYSTFEQSDFLPFSAGIEAGAPCILVSHNIVECMDASLPASLSPEVHRILREELGFQGIVITDDLAMDAVAESAGSVNAAVLAVQAGNDLLLCSDFAPSYRAVLAAVENGDISAATVEASAARVLAWKLWLQSL